MMRSIVNPDHVKNKLAPVIEALQAIDGEAVCFDPEIFEHAAGLLLWCQATVAQIDAPQTETEESESNPSAELVTAVGLRALTLTMQIDAENRLGQSVLDQYDRDLAELKYSGATISQVKVLEADAKARAESHRINIVDLQAQKNILEDFLATGPDYDLSLLAGGEIDQSQEAQPE